MNAKTTAYETAELKKMNTSVLIRAFVRIAGYNPQGMDRQMMIMVIWSKQHTAYIEAAEKTMTSPVEVWAAREREEASRKFSDHQIGLMRTRWNGGHGDSINELAKEFGCKWGKMRDIVERRSYRTIG